MTTDLTAPVRALVTGAGGFVGRHLLQYLVAETGWVLYGNTHSRPSDNGDADELARLLALWPSVVERIEGQSKGMASVFRNPELVHPVWVGQGVCRIGFIDPKHAVRSREVPAADMIQAAIREVLGYECRVETTTFDEVGDVAGRTRWVTADLTDRAQTHEMVGEVKPDFVFHLAAQSNVQQAFKDPEATLMNNVVGQLNLLDALREHSPEARVMVACSSEQYGLVQPGDIPIDEDTLFRPNNPYAVSKIAQDALALQYFLTYGMKTIRVRPFNHIGPGQSEHFVTAAFARQVALIEAGKQEPVVFVGNLDAERDFTDARDVVRAYHLAITLGEPGEAYNIGSGQGRTIQWVLDTFLGMSTATIEVRNDPARMRPSDIPQLICDPTRFSRQTGWQPEIPVEQTLGDILDYWRGVVSSQ